MAATTSATTPATNSVNLTPAFLAFALLCVLPLFSDAFVALVAQASGVSGALAYAFAWSAAFAMGLIGLAIVGIPSVLLWHLFGGSRRAY